MCLWRVCTSSQALHDIVGRWKHRGWFVVTCGLARARARLYACRVRARLTDFCPPLLGCFSLLFIQATPGPSRSGLTEPVHCGSPRGQPCG